jgi:CMP-N,N'-diacetyllegionaminic acid synthase
MTTVLIPARGGSKRVPLKNIQKLGGRPLVDWAIALSTESEVVTKTIVSTDSLDIIVKSQFLSKYCDEFTRAPFGELIEISATFSIHKRREQSATDHAKTYSVIKELMTHPQSISEQLLLLQPTSPFRTKEEINELLNFQTQVQARSVLSVKSITSPHPNKIFEIDEVGRIKMYKSEFESLTTPEQELPRLYAPDGAFYLATKDFILKNKSLISEESACFVRTGQKTLNIDSQADLNFAQYLIDSKSNII